MSKKNHQAKQKIYIVDTNAAFEYFDNISNSRANFVFTSPVLFEIKLRQKDAQCCKYIEDQCIGTSRYIEICQEDWDTAANILNRAQRNQEKFHGISKERKQELKFDALIFAIAFNRNATAIITKDSDFDTLSECAPKNKKTPRINHSDEFFASSN